MSAALQPDRPAGFPAHVRAEKAILGAVLLDNSAFYIASEAGIAADDFSLDSHRRIWRSMMGILDAMRPVDIMTLADDLGRGAELATVGGAAYLAELTEGVPRRPAVAEYARMVLDRADARRLVEVADRAIGRAEDMAYPAAHAIAETVEALEAMARRKPREARPLFAALGDDQILMERQLGAPEGVLGASLITPELDRVTGGIQEGEMCLLCARPMQGKTEAACQVVLANARRGLKVHVFSLEMSAQQLARRMTRLAARVPVSSMRDPRTLARAERQAIVNAREELAGLPISIDDTHELTCAEFRARAIVAARRQGADLLVVDYGQLLLAPKAKGMIEEAKQQAETLRHIARDYCRVLALAQLRRAPPNDLNLYPDIEMIYGSSAWEQAAQIVLLLHRTRKEKRYTGEDYCIVGKLRESQSIQPLGIRAERWGEFRDRYAGPEVKACPANLSDRGSCYT